jgi:hypothetical protein
LTTFALKFPTLSSVPNRPGRRYISSPCDRSRRSTCDSRRNPGTGLVIRIAAWPFEHVDVRGRRSVMESDRPSAVKAAGRRPPPGRISPCVRTPGRQSGSRSL